MRYLTITYFKKANGQMDESVAVCRNIKTRDIQLCSVILDFLKLEVVKASMGGTVIPRDFDRIVQYYHQHYASTIERLFAENGYTITKAETPDDTVDKTPDQSVDVV